MMKLYEGYTVDLIGLINDRTALPNPLEMMSFDFENQHENYCKFLDNNIHVFTSFQ